MYKAVEASVPEDRNPTKQQNKQHKIEPASAPAEQLHFINIADPGSVKTIASKRVVRSYAARATHRKIRQDRVLDFQNRQHAESRSQTISKPNQSNFSQVNEPILSPNSPPRICLTALKTSTSPTPLLTGGVRLSIDPLSSGYGDPFQSLAIQLSPSEQYLLEHCTQYYFNRPSHTFIPDQMSYSKLYFTFSSTLIEG